MAATLMETFKSGLMCARSVEDPRTDLPAAHVRDLRHRLTGPRGIAILERRQQLAGKEDVLVAVGLDVDVAGGFCLEYHAVDRTLGELCRNPCPLDGRLLDSDTRSGRFLLVLEVLHGLLLAIAR